MATNFNNPYAPVLETRQDFSSRFPIASLAKRFFGAMLDGIISFLIVLPGFIAIVIEIAQQVPNSQPASLGPIGIAGIAWIGSSVLVIAGFQIYLLVTRSQTIGKYLVNTQIVDHESGEPAGFLKAFVVRGFVNGLIGAIPFIGVFYSIVDILFIFRADRRCLHDLLASTSVVDISAA